MQDLQVFKQDYYMENVLSCKILASNASLIALQVICNILARKLQCKILAQKMSLFLQVSCKSLAVLQLISPWDTLSTSTENFAYSIPRTGLPD